jgi:hypothetical protein
MSLCQSNNLRPAERRTRIANGFEALLFGSLESRMARFNIWEYMVTFAKRDLILRFNHRRLRRCWAPWL